jgi:hypothetical protein
MYYICFPNNSNIIVDREVMQRILREEREDNVPV